VSNAAVSYLQESKRLERRESLCEVGKSTTTERMTFNPVASHGGFRYNLVNNHSEAICAVFAVNISSYQMSP